MATKKTNKINKIQKDFNDLGPVIFGLFGAFLLVLPEISELLGKHINKKDASFMFIASLLLITYSTITGSIDLHLKHKKITDIKKEIKLKNQAIKQR